MIALSPSGTENDPVLIRILIAAIGPAITVLLAWLVGHKLSAWGEERQKSRELAILAANKFYRIYGELTQSVFQPRRFCTAITRPTSPRTPASPFEVPRRQLTVHQRVR
jgi:hypothetical protein